MSRSSSVAASAATALTTGAVAFGAGAGTELSRTTFTEMAVVLAAGLALAVVVLCRPRGDLHGGLTLLLFAVFVAVTALSVSWSIAPDLSLQEGARAFSYLALLAVAVAAGRLAPKAAPAVLAGLLVACVAVAAWALITRIFPGALSGDVYAGRLSEPLGYWNALAGMAACGVPGAIWVATRREGRELARAAAYPAMGVLLLVILLTQSRGALAAAMVAAAIWVAAVPLRLRTALALAVPALVVAPVAAWALSKDAFTGVAQPDSARAAVAGEFGLMVLAAVAVLFAAGLAIQRLWSRSAPTLRVRRRAGIAVAVVAAALPLVALTSVAASDGGLSDTLSDRVDSIRGNSPPPTGAARIASTGSSRGSYWRQARQVFAERELLGRGAGSFQLASLKYRKSFQLSAHAHGFIAQTAADLGLLGLAAALAMLAAWLAAAARAIGLWPRVRPRPQWTGERTALSALSLAVVIYGLQSLIDWNWFIPGLSAIALIAAGFVAGRGPLGAPAAAARRPSLRLGPGLAAAGIVVTAGLCAWAIWQPERSARAIDRAAALVASGKLGEAREQVRRARAVAPYSPEPLWAQAELLTAAGRPRQAYRVLEQAVLEHPRDPEAWLRLGRFELRQLDLPDRAIDSSVGAFTADPYSRQAIQLRDAAMAAQAR